MSVRVLVVSAIALSLLGGPKLLLAIPRSSVSVDKFETHVVMGGETLWQIAEEHAPGEDPRSYIYELKRLNDLPSVQVVPGQLLKLPQ